MTFTFDFDSSTMLHAPDPGEELELLTKGLMGERSLSYSLAFSEAQREHPALARAYAESCWGQRHP